MEIFNKIKTTIFGKKEEQIPEHRDSNTVENWEKQFLCFSEFTCAQKNNTICTYFKEGETRKREISQYVQDSIDGGMDLNTIITNCHILYSLSVAYKVYVAENKILLFFDVI